MTEPFAQGCQPFGVEQLPQPGNPKRKFFDWGYNVDEDVASHCNAR